MPSKSRSQHNLMAMVANDPAKAKQLGIPQSVGQEFVQADKGMKFGKAPTKSRADLQKINSPKTEHGKSAFFRKGGQSMATKKMAMGGPSTMPTRAMPAQSNMGGASRGLDRAGAMSGRTFAKGGITTAKMGAVKTAAPSRDGMATKGKTKGTVVKMSGSKPLGMKKGGKAC